MPSTSKELWLTSYGTQKKIELNRKTKQNQLLCATLDQILNVMSLSFKAGIHKAQQRYLPMKSDSSVKMIVSFLEFSSFGAKCEGNGTKRGIRFL